MAGNDPSTRTNCSQWERHWISEDPAEGRRERRKLVGQMNSRQDGSCAGPAMVEEGTSRLTAAAKKPARAGLVAGRIDNLLDSMSAKFNIDDNSGIPRHIISAMVSYEVCRCSKSFSTAWCG